MENEKIYKGYKKIIGNTEYINEYMDNLDPNDWACNEYIIINNTDDDTSKEMRWDGKSFVPLRLPPQKWIKGKNELQRCALDMLNNPEITICVLLGCPGSGKSKLATAMSLYAVREKGTQSKICFVREPWGEGRSMGYLKGDFAQKNAVWELPIIQQFDGQEFQVDRLKQQGVVEFNIPTYMKGLSFPSEILVVDECEDVSEKQLRLLGTRVGQEGRIFFAGDIKQSLLDVSDNNPMVKMCNYFKGNPLFGCIWLEDDVRSETSKLFAHMYFD